MNVHTGGNVVSIAWLIMPAGLFLAVLLSARRVRVKRDQDGLPAERADSCGGPDA